MNAKKFNKTLPYGTLIPPTDGCYYQQHGCLYDQEGKFVRVDESTAEGQRLLKGEGYGGAPATSHEVKAEIAAPAVEDAPVVVVEDGEINLDAILDESADDLGHDGLPVNNEADIDGFAELKLYLAGKAKMRWFEAAKLAEDTLGSKPGSKAELEAMMEGA